MNPDSTSILLTCEHATHHIPVEYRRLFRGAYPVLASHRGWDPGAREMAQSLSHDSGARLICGKVSRLLVELNRSIGHPQLWSEFTDPLPEADKAAILANQYVPYRNFVHHHIGRHLAAGETVLHFSIHTFAPVLHGRIRNCDVGLLFDPARPSERSIARELRAWLRFAIPGLRVRMNYPYRGTDDGCTTWLREHFPTNNYSGIEIEFNQSLLLDREGLWSTLKECLGYYLTSYENFGHGLTSEPDCREVRFESSLTISLDRIATN